MINYKPVLPSSLVKLKKPNSNSVSYLIHNDYTLKVGTILETIEVDDKLNQNKRTPEYNVMVIYQNKGKGVNSSIYKNCTATDSFGGIADYFQFKRRSSTSSKKTKDSGSLNTQNGSIVLLLCLDGSSENGIIIGALAHPNKPNILTKEKGTHLEAEFNGLNWQVDKDGALTLTFKSATDNDGNPQDTNAGGTTWKIEKDGSIELSDGNDESIRIDKTAKTISFKSKSDISAETEANYSVTAKKNINLSALKDLLIDAGGSANIKTATSFKLDAGSSIALKTKSMSINLNSMSIKGTNIELKAPSVNLGLAPSPAVTLLTQFIGVGNLGIPVVSTAVGPFSTSVNVSI